MNSLQRHLTDNYSLLHRMCAIKFNSASTASHALSAAYCKLDGNSATVDNVGAYVRSAVINCGHNEMRKLDKKIECKLVYFENEAALQGVIDKQYSFVPMLAEELTSKDQAAKARKLMKRLSSKAQTILHERFVLELSFAEISRRHKWNLNTVKATFKYNLKMLRKYQEGTRQQKEKV